MVIDGAVGLDREHRARLHRLAVDEHGARAARRRVAPDLGAGEPRTPPAGTARATCAARRRARCVAPFTVMPICMRSPSSRAGRSLAPIRSVQRRHRSAADVGTGGRHRDPDQAPAARVASRRGSRPSPGARPRRCGSTRPGRPSRRAATRPRRSPSICTHCAVECSPKMQSDTFGSRRDVLRLHRGLAAADHDLPSSSTADMTGDICGDRPPAGRQDAAVVLADEPQCGFRVHAPHYAPGECSRHGAAASAASAAPGVRRTLGSSRLSGETGSRGSVPTIARIST